MELLLDNLRSVFFKGKHGKAKQIILVDKQFVIRVAVTLSLSLIIGRAALGNSIEPVSLAFITVLLVRGKANIYALPFIGIGMLSVIKSSYNYTGDLSALLICSVAFLLPGVRKFPLSLKTLIAGALMICSKVAYYLWSGSLYLYNGGNMAMDLLLLFASVYIFWVFFRLLDQGAETCSNPLEAVMATVAIILIASGNLAFIHVGPVSVLHVIAFLITLTVGYCMGAAEGGLAGILGGFIVMLLTLETPALAGILGSCGAVGGLFHGNRRWMAGISFAGTALIFGVLKGFPGMYVSIYEPIAAAVIFSLIPARVMEFPVRFLSLLKKDDNFYELTARKKVKEQIKEYADLFNKLALTSGSMGEYQPARDILARQFKGMARALDKMAAEVSSQNPPLQPKNKRYELQIGMASYAKEGKISGDSCLYTPVNEGEYLIALSDGMGQGVRAAEESSLTVNTLYNLVKAGFDVELALRMVNSILLQKSNDEIFSTLDMGFINLYTGRIKIFKIGASAGFIKRGDTVKAIKIPALPMGIIEKIPMESISMQLKKGDEFIIVSDGITDAERLADGLEWVENVIEEIKSRDPQTMADLIISRAVQKYGLREKDDMTVIVVLVK